MDSTTSSMIQQTIPSLTESIFQLNTEGSVDEAETWSPFTVHCMPTHRDTGSISPLESFSQLLVPQQRLSLMGKMEVEIASEDLDPEAKRCLSLVQNFVAQASAVEIRGTYVNVGE